MSSTAHTGTADEYHNLVSVPSKNDNHPYAQHSSLTVKFASPFSLYTCVSISSYICSIFTFQFPVVDNLPLQNEFYMEHAQKLGEVRRVLNEVGEGRFEVLLMIDAIQRLGIDYHFHEEIEAILPRQYKIFITTDDFSDNLYEVALRFRLLRQEGYYVTAGDRFPFFL